MDAGATGLQQEHPLLWYVSCCTMYVVGIIQPIASCQDHAPVGSKYCVHPAAPVKLSDTLLKTPVTAKDTQLRVAATTLPDYIDASCSW